jgi:hypothetical protein
MYHDDFLFHDGSRAKKLFIILGCKNDRFLVAKTTSQNGNKSLVPGCHPADRFHNFYIEAGKGFRKNTWICLHEFYEFSASELTQLRSEGSIYKICDMTQAVMDDLTDCAKQSDDISPDQITILE